MTVRRASAACGLQSADPTSIDRQRAVGCLEIRQTLEGREVLGLWGTKVVQVSLTEAGCCHGTDYITPRRGLQATASAEGLGNNTGLALSCQPGISHQHSLFFCVDYPSRGNLTIAYCADHSR